jgi:hypothetical protein
MQKFKGYISVELVWGYLSFQKNDKKEPQTKINCWSLVVTLVYPAKDWGFAGVRIGVAGFHDCWLYREHHREVVRPVGEVVAMVGEVGR